MDSPFEIDAKSGTLKFPQVLLTLAPQQPLAVFLATEVGARAQRERGNNEWQLYSLRRDLADGRKLGATLIFTSGRLAQVRFDYRSERETDWSSWSQERELARANDYQREIVRQLGTSGRFSWGFADGVYDDKAASAVLVVKYGAE